MDDEVDAMNHFHELPTELQDVLADWPARRAITREEGTMTNTENRTNTTIDWGQLHEELARPFSDAAIKYRVGAISKDKTKAQALPYVDPRAYEDRLNELVPGAWSVAFEPWGSDRIICRLTIHGITRSSTGDGAGSPDQVAGTAAEAQAFKRAASKFGLGRHLYDMPAPWMAYDAERRTIRSPSQPCGNPSHGGQRAPRDLPQKRATSSDSVRLGHERAAKFHLELIRRGVPRCRHASLVSEVLKHPVKGLYELTEDEARRVLRFAPARTAAPQSVGGPSKRAGS